MNSTADPRRATELWLVRHGESAGNADGLFQGQREYPLSPRGRAQAAALAARVAGAGFAAIHASDLGRARETAAIVAAATGATVVVEPALREIDTGAWSGLTAAEVQRRFPDEWTRWMAHRDPAHRRGGGESYDDVQARMRVAIARIAEHHAGARVLVVAHGGCLTAWIAGMLEMPLAALWRSPLANTGITRVLPFATPPPGMDTPPGRLLCYNDTAHLDIATTEHAT